MSEKKKMIDYRIIADDRESTIEYAPGKYKRLLGSIEEDVGTLLSLGYVLYGNPWTFKQFDSELKRDSICHCQAIIKFKPSQKA